MRIPDARWYRRVRASERTSDLLDAGGAALVGLLTIAVGIDGVWTDLAEHRPPGPATPLVLLAVGCALMVPKRRWPVGVLVAGVALFAVDAYLGGSIGVIVVLVDLIYSAAIHARPRAAAVLRTSVVAVGAVATALLWSVTHDAQVTVFLALQYFALIGTPLWWGTAVRRQSELTDLATARAEDQRRLASLQAAELVAEERAQMARDLHDAIAGNLSAIAIHAEAALAVPPTDPRAAARDRAALESVRAASVTSLQEMRAMILLLRADGAASDDPTVAAPRLREAAELVAATEAAGLHVAWDGTTLDELPALPSAVDQAAYRILQESLTNAAKHAPGSHVRVAVEVHDGALTLAVESTAARVGADADDRVVVASGAGRADRPLAGRTGAVGAAGAAASGGIGAAGVAASGGAPDRAADGSGLGLVTMRERAEALGGRFSAGRTDGSRWSVVATLPLGSS
ncbi:histidine kinase [Cellulomonas cellasea]|uniref:histidine kinase n=1 Tax=Cellulomonas cellasea TaxID=43670 RepID=A0A7W4UI68_9CELL|nr:histidine kinase [Cellulomonas cellasea]MBB2924632.1 signal transduction histidine kinase [Cellulomonas cellasea]